MKNYIIHDEWKIIEQDFHPEENRITESLLSIGNGRTGQRANFEERYSGDSLRGSYVAGVYYPDKTRVGWWKNGYPEYFAKILNATNWIGIDIEVDGEVLDLNKVRIVSFYRHLDMRSGLLFRQFMVFMDSGKIVEVKASRFLSIDDQEIGAIRYSIRAINFSGTIVATPYVDGNVVNEDSNYNENFWIGKNARISGSSGLVRMETKKTAFQVSTGMDFRTYLNGQKIDPPMETIEKENYIGAKVSVKVNMDEEFVIEKFAAIISTLYYPVEELEQATEKATGRAVEAGFDKLFKAQKKAWTKRWETSDIHIDGDVAAQQGIRFN
ncbi:MAG: glycoside hydrolase family 65 protein, partial [Candidatus Saccharibacteria bacterium]